MSVSEQNDPGLSDLSKSRLQTLYEVGRDISALLDWNDLVGRMLDVVMETLKAERGVLFLRGPDGSPRPEVARGADEKTLAGATETSRRILEQSLTRGEALLSDDARADERFASASVTLYNIVSFMCVPLRRGERILGTLYVDHRSLADLFTKEDLSFLTALADLCAIALENSMLHQEVTREVRRLRRDVEGKYRFENLLGADEAMLRLFRVLEKVVESEVTVLIQGENGTGKELVARAIHFNGPRKAKPFVTIDCGALPESLAASELFGHRRGAFTDAREDRPGLFEQAHGGTVFLDQIEDLALPLQPQLLRVLQEGQVRRIGETEYRSVNCRVVAASRVGLDGLVKAGRFREDLYYRLRVVPLDVPSLRDRKSDIPLLAQHFLERLRGNHEGQGPVGFTKEAMALMLSYPWPGNVRELEHAIQRAALLAPGTQIDAADLGIAGPREEPGDLRETRRSGPAGGGDQRPEGVNRGRPTRGDIEQALMQCRGNVTLAAQSLGVTRRGLQKILKRHGLERGSFE